MPIFGFLIKVKYYLCPFSQPTKNEDVVITKIMDVIIDGKFLLGIPPNNFDDDIDHFMASHFEVHNLT